MRALGRVEPEIRPPDEEALLEKNEEVPMGGCCAACCECYWCCCGTCTVFILWVLLVTWTTQCGVTTFPVEHILASNAIADGTITPYEMGTSLNMNVDPALNIDLTGAWWMDGNPAIFEQVVSFAGAVGAAPFPVSIPMPTNFKGRWTYSDTLLARLVMAYHAWTTAVNDAHLFMFANSTSAEIVPVAQAAFGGQNFGFNKISNDEWNRGDVYTLRRIIYEDGTPHPVFWPNFLNWYRSIQPNGKIVVYGSDNMCIRRCQFVMPCFVCKAFCGPP